MKATSRTKFCLLTVLFCLIGLCASQAADSGKMLNIFTRHEDGATHFFVENREVGTITVTFEMKLKNLVGNTNFPCTEVIPGNQTVEVFSLTSLDKTASSKYSYVRSSLIGSANAVHDDSCVYLLPYAAGASFRVSQGYHGTFSHQGPDEYAIDWQMPEGTAVHAARDGLVVEARDDSDRGGSSPKYEKFANQILIQHSDGTVGVYGHLKKGGCRVKVGDHVKAGDLIALSGNTGYSNGPHLHFAVYKTRDGYQRESLPVKFRDTDGQAVMLAEDHWYQAAPVEVSAIVHAAGQPQASAE